MRESFFFSSSSTYLNIIAATFITPPLCSCLDPIFMYYCSFSLLIKVACIAILYQVKAKSKLLNQRWTVGSFVLSFLLVVFPFALCRTNFPHVSCIRLLVSNVAIGCNDRKLCAYTRQKTWNESAFFMFFFPNLWLVSSMPSQRLQSFKVCAMWVLSFLGLVTVG